MRREIYTARRLRAGAWVSDSAIREALVAALDNWAACAGTPSRRNWLLEVARRADPDPWRDRVREPELWGDKAALEAGLVPDVRIVRRCGAELDEVGRVEV